MSFYGKPLDYARDDTSQKNDVVIITDTHNVIDLQNHFKRFK